MSKDKEGMEIVWRICFDFRTQEEMSTFFALASALLPQSAEIRQFTSLISFNEKVNIRVVRDAADLDRGMKMIPAGSRGRKVAMSY